MGSAKWLGRHAVDLCGGSSPLACGVGLLFDPQHTTAILVSVCEGDINTSLKESIQSGEKNERSAQQLSHFGEDLSLEGAKRNWGFGGLKTIGNLQHPKLKPLDFEKAFLFH